MIKWKEASGRARTNRVEIKLNNEEYQKLQSDVKKLKCTMSEYLRNLIVDAKLKEKPDKDFYYVMNQMSKIGVNLNQIAKKANQTNDIDKNEYKKEAIKWNNFMKNVIDNYL